MKRPTVLVLLLTFVALVVASVWVPKRPGFNYEMTANPVPAKNGAVVMDGMRVTEWRVSPQADQVPRQWVLAWDSKPILAVEDEDRDRYRISPPNGVPMRGLVADWPLLALMHGLILAIGGLLALALHIRERKRLAISHR